MSVWFGDYLFEEEFNDDRASATRFPGKAIGNVNSVTDIDWYTVDLPKNTQIGFTFKGLNFKTGTWNVSWFSSDLKLLLEQNITVSNSNPEFSSHFSSGNLGGGYYLRVKAYTAESYKPDTYQVNITSPASLLPTVSVLQTETTVAEGDTSNPLVPATITLSGISTSDVLVSYTLRSGTATVTPNGSDIFGITSGTLIFAPGETSKSLSTTFILSDTTIEGNEYFYVDFNRIALGNAQFPAGSNSVSVKVNIINDDFDRSAPLATSFSPVDESVAVSPSTDIRVTFSESIQRGFGNIVVKTSSGAVVSSFAANSSSEISILGNVLTINSINDLEYGTSYYVELPIGSVKDLAGNNYAGTSAYNFATAANPANQTFSGTNLNDTFKGGTGDDYIDGSGGIDSAQYDGRRANYIVTKSGNDFKVIDTVGTDGTDTVVRIERLKFADFNVALDWYGNAGTAAKVLGAVFGKEYLTNKTYVGIGLDLLDKGMDYADLVSMAVSTDVFAQLAGSRSNTDFVKLVYKNVMGATPPAADLGYFVGLLDNGTYTQTSLALLACETDANKVHVDLVGLANTGIEYLPQPGG